jgi:glutathione S-transferase
VSLPVLWHFPISHFNEKVRWALDWKGIPHVREALSTSYLPRALWATGQPRLPILFIDGKPYADSTRIIAEIERRWPNHPLYPREPALRRRALALEDWFDEELGPAVRTALIGPMFDVDPEAAVATLMTGMGDAPMRRVGPILPMFVRYYRWRHAITPETVRKAKTQVLAALDRLEAEVGSSGHLVGDRFSIADLTAAALFSPIVRPAEFPYLPEGAPPPTFVAYRDELAGRPGIEWVREIYRRHRGVSAEVVSAAKRSA